MQLTLRVPAVSLQQIYVGGDLRVGSSKRHGTGGAGGDHEAERKMFPKHESLTKSFHNELTKKNSGLLYLKIANVKGVEEIVGYAMYSWISSLCASITKLAVKENYRRQGHGEAILKAAIQKCRTRKIHRVCLHVDPTRIPAVSLYRKLGFQIDELIERYYSPERNAYRMYLEFND